MLASPRSSLDFAGLIRGATRAALSLACLLVLIGSPGEAAAQCGNAVINAGEVCDPPNVLGPANGCAANRICNNTCTACVVPGTCGNGAIDAGEMCELPGSSGPGNGCILGQICRSNCAMCLAATTKTVCARGKCCTCIKVGDEAKWGCASRPRNVSPIRKA